MKELILLWVSRDFAGTWTIGEKSESCNHMRESLAWFLAINMLVVSFLEVINARESCLKR